MLERHARRIRRVNCDSEMIEDNDFICLALTDWATHA